MDTIRDYLISITAAAIITGLAAVLTKNSGSISSIIKLLAGLFMTVTILTPIIQLPLSSFQLYLDEISYDADYASTAGKSAADEEIEKIIIERTRAYILDKADDFGAGLDVDVIVKDLIPCSVNISGPVSPSAKSQLSRYISENLGIPLEAQNWIG